uniref:VM domain-containing protein n=1 Tax=Anopheles arabiensis TaxID=7173 RepID=A0A182HTA3_ANOAR
MMVAFRPTHLTALVVVCCAVLVPVRTASTSLAKREAPLPPSGSYLPPSGGAGGYPAAQTPSSSYGAPTSGAGSWGGNGGNGGRGHSNGGGSSFGGSAPSAPSQSYGAPSFGGQSSGAGQQLERLPTPQMLNHCQHTDNGYATRTRTGNGYCKTRALFKINYNVYPPVFYYGRRAFHHCKTPRPTGLLGPFDG